MVNPTAYSAHSNQSHKSIMTHHSRNRCMSFIEWTCIAGLPTLLCISKIIVHSSKLFSFENDYDATKEVGKIISYQTCPINTINEVYNSLLMFPLCILVVTVIISLATIISFGDAQENNDNIVNQQSKRGMGIVVGSHLVPLLYMAMILYTFDHNIYCSEDILAEDYVQQQYNQYAAGRWFNHFEFASLGGLSFAISTLWIKKSQYNHRKFHGKRRMNGTNGKHINGVKKDEQHNKLYSATSMSICWKTYCMLITCQSTRGVLSSDNGLCTPLLGMIHILLIILYDQKTINVTAQYKAQNTMIRDGACWQDAFTPGEWMVVSTFIASLIGAYILEYSGIQELLSNSNKADIMIQSFLPIHLVVAHAGFVGCLVGVTLCSFVQKEFVSAGHNAKSFTSVLSLVAVTAITVGCLELALKAKMDISSEYCGIESTTQCNNDTHMLSNYSGDWMIPLSLQWIFNFLLSVVDVSFGGYTIHTLRVSILGYWAIVLTVCLPVSSILMSWIARSNKKDANKENDNIQKHVHKNRNKRVTIARKYFHLVAILLFTPITWLDPSMMSLSYAIAVSLLIVLEMVRGWTANSNICTPSVWNDMYMTFLDEKDSSAANGGLAVTHIALIVGCALPLWVTQLLQQRNNIPSVQTSNTHYMYSSPHELFLVLLPFLGVLVLGVGDSAGAIFGNLGRHCWPGGSSRTIEGSMCMLLSMMMIVVIFIASTHAIEHHISYFLQVSTTTGLLITLIEASTSQIDNLVLPVAGSTLILLVTLISE